MDFLAEVRTRLHFRAGRRDDRLKFDTQDIVAAEMGFEDTAERRAVEGFMREYYRHAAYPGFFRPQSSCASALVPEAENR